MCKYLKQTIIKACLLITVAAGATTSLAQPAIPDKALDIFDEKCAFSGCHLGSSAPKGLDLSERRAFKNLVNKPSSDFGQKRLLVKPQDPIRSYLMMKIEGDISIKGAPMPKSGQPLPAEETAIIKNWIASLPLDANSNQRNHEGGRAFSGLSLATLPTAQTQEPGSFSYRIAHRWLGSIRGGFDDFFGLDNGAAMFLQLAFPIVKNLSFDLGRSGIRDTYELALKWRFMNERRHSSFPLSAAIVLGVDWTSEKILNNAKVNRFNSERIHLFAQFPVSMQLWDRISVLLVPGALLNGNTAMENESPLTTIGFGVKCNITDTFSFFVEGTPIVSGAANSEATGRRTSNATVVFNDAFSVGLEKRTSGHLFHVYLTNSSALTTNQSMSGADFDFLKGDLRLGFNIYRNLKLSF